jgi:hypothetical protein
MENPHLSPNEEPEKNSNISLDGLSSRAIEHIKTELDDDMFKQSIIDDLTNNPKYLPFFNQYTDHHRKSFIEWYANKRLLCKKYGSMYLKQKEEKHLQHIQKAYKCLSEISQKKIFDKQCLWKAEQIKLPQIEISEDFRVWEEYPMCCPFIDPITPDDVALYKKYILSDEYVETDYYYGWQDYDGIKNAFDSTNDDNEDSKQFFFFDIESVPSWYEFYDFHKATQLLMLPDIRGKKEDFYIDLAREKAQKEHEEEQKKNPPIVKPNDPRPALYLGEGQNVYKFMAMFEDPEVLEAAKAMDEEIDLLDDHEFEQACSYLSNTAPNYVITKQGNWRDLIVEAAETHRRHAVANMLEAAYEEYLFKLEMGLLVLPADYKKDKHGFDISEINRKRILEGRILNGEEPNLDF